MILKIGHSGAKGYEPENTLRSFKKAINLGVDMIELDVYICKTGEVVVMHDNKVDRMTNGSGYVDSKSLKQLKKLKIKKSEKIPTLREVLNLINRKTKINIELKGEKIASPVLSIIKEYVNKNNWSYDDFLISSFNHYELQKFNKLNKDIKIGALTYCIPIGFAEFAEKINTYSIHLSKDFINKKFVNDAHKRNLKVFVYTVNDIDDIKRIKKLGVDGIFSDYPDRL
ncbi:MAG: glycerophosphodiester phosphodiesterase [Candidatus Falkowbacteria bacterium]